MSSSTAPPDLPGVAHRWVTVDGVRLHVAEAGTEHRDVDGRPSLVLVHGWPQHWWCWHRVIPLLARTHHVVAVDLRGHGWSDVPAPGHGNYDKRRFADDVIGLIGAMDLDRPVVIGHDWGAWTALLVAGRAPGLTRGVVATAIIAPWTDIPTTDMWRFLYQVAAGGPWGSLVHRAFGKAFLRTVYKLGSHGRREHVAGENDVYLERYDDPARRAAGRSVYGTFLRAEFPAVAKGTYQAPVTDVPIIFLPGRGDAILVPRIVERGVVADNMSMETIEGAGHWVPEEQPEKLVEKIQEFLAGLT
ncbi:hydrolase, alpha/beta domain protein [Aeromicrobium marinum DSM 15272]|uniref:Hydrolase, alpha/beta domain protein n=1 Tax=Aeromicrobium marinum DSM 15272 TaxID=585531 RepID=E2SC66_9ACTN|nr:alpha/beta hydrolase [Aeromicrobium marinum]EFQ83352.1 hydrolase, alpha/beta domain protein [Aeromicrobium marinum DSM 15272]